MLDQGLIGEVQRRLGEQLMKDLPRENALPTIYFGVPSGVTFPYVKIILDSVTSYLENWPGAGKTTIEFSVSICSEYSAQGIAYDILKSTRQAMDKWIMESRGDKISLVRKESSSLSTSEKEILCISDRYKALIRA